jgi:hypothetical protein
MSLKGLVYLIAGLVFAGASIYAGIRSRMRVRAMIEEDVKPLSPCTIPRPAVVRFLNETRMLRALIAGLVEQATDGIRGELYGDDGASFDLGTYSRALAGWIRTYEHELDAEDREALATRGVAASSVLSLRESSAENAPPTSLDGLRRHAIELDRFEAAMTEAPRLAAYR